MRRKRPYFAVFLIVGLFAVLLTVCGIDMPSAAEVDSGQWSVVSGG